MVLRGEDDAILWATPMKTYSSTADEEDKMQTPPPKGRYDTAEREQRDRGGVLLRAPLPETQTYHRRWYVLFVFLITGVMQGWMWNTFAPIAVALQYVGWPLQYVSAIQVVLCISSTFGAPLCAWIMDRKGLRLAMIFASLTLALGCSIRCFTPVSPAFFIWNVFAFAIDGLGGTVPLSAASAFSAVWFPPKQRAFATAVCVEATNIGTAIAFLIGPAVVSTRVPVLKSTVNGTQIYLDENVQESINAEIMRLMYMQCGIAVWLLILVLCYFPKQPPKPPSISAYCQREKFGIGIREALKNWKLWLLFLPYGTGCGIYYGWTAVYDVLLRPDRFDEAEAGRLAFYGNICGILAAVGVSIGAGFLQRHLKKIVILIMSIATIAVILFICTSMGYMPFSIVCLYVGALLSGAMLYAVVPLCFELACEIIYPISENIVCLVVQWWNNFFVILFFLLFLIPTQRSWMNWVVLASAILSVISSVLLPDIYARLSIDEISEGNELNENDKKKIGFCQSTVDTTD